jgi:hypothetical protein
MTTPSRTQVTKIDMAMTVQGSSPPLQPAQLISGLPLRESGLFHRKIEKGRGLKQDLHKQR